MDSNLLKKISKDIFLDGNALSNPVPLKHEGRGVLWRCDGKEGRIFVVKHTTLREAINHQYAQYVGISVPKVYGWYSDSTNRDRFYLVMEFVNGKRLENVYNHDVSSYRDVFENAVATLAKIHGSKRILKWFCSDAGKLFEAETKKIREKVETIKKAFEVYKMYKEESGLEAVVTQTKIENLRENVDPQELGRKLFIESEMVFQHGDYKPNNIIISDSAIIAILDWPSSGPGTPWYDLAYLFADVKVEDAKPFIKSYINYAHTQSLLSSISEQDAYELFRVGRIYQEVVRANSNATIILQSEKLDSHNIEQYERGVENASQFLKLS